MPVFNLDFVSLIALLLTIVVAVIKKINCGVTAIACVGILTAIYDIPLTTVFEGLNSSLFITLVGVTYLFAIVRLNGTLELVANKLINPFRKHIWLIPIIIFAVAFILCAAGPGAIPLLAIIPIISVSVANAVGMNPVMLSLIGVAGVWGGRMSPITPETVVVTNLLEKDGVQGSLFTYWTPLLLVSVIMAILPFLYYRGWRCAPLDESQLATTTKLSRQQTLSVVGIIVMMVLALAFDYNVGLVSFCVGVMLIMLGAGDEKKSIDAVPWNIIMLVMGMGVLMNIIVTSGGIAILSHAMSSVMTAPTGSAIMESIAGIMSFFSSGLGVVFPTLLPTVSGISASMGGAVSPTALAIAIVIGGTISGISPVGTAGGLILAANGDGEAGNNRLFIELFAWAGVAMILGVIVGLLGIFG